MHQFLYSISYIFFQSLWLNIKYTSAEIYNVVAHDIFNCKFVIMVVFTNVSTNQDTM